jgi:hypothetical protein
MLFLYVFVAFVAAAVVVLFFVAVVVVVAWVPWCLGALVRSTNSY